MYKVSPDKCGSCKYWERMDKGTVLGFCHKRSPEVRGWPKASEHEWCGDYKPTARETKIRDMSGRTCIICRLGDHDQCNGSFIVPSGRGGAIMSSCGCLTCFKGTLE